MKEHRIPIKRLTGLPSEDKTLRSARDGLLRPLVPQRLPQRSAQRAHESSRGAEEGLSIGKFVGANHGVLTPDFGPLTSTRRIYSPARTWPFNALHPPACAIIPNSRTTSPDGSRTAFPFDCGQAGHTSGRELESSQHQTNKLAPPI